MTRQAFHITSIGASHIKSNKICQDSSASFQGEGFQCIIVSDGHGGDDYIRSDKGSEFAVSASSECVCDFVRSVKIEQLRSNSKGMFSQLAKSIISNWNDKVWSHYSQVPLSEQEQKALSEKAKRKYIIKQKIESLYGATLIVAVVTDSYWFGLHIGDGKCVIKNYDASFRQPIPWDDKCFLNATTSICDSDALNNFRHYFSEELPAAVFIGSDGIDDCFMNDTQLHNLYDAIIASFGQDGFDQALTDLRDYIPRLSAKGSGDDMSMAGILDMENIRTYMSHTFDEKANQGAAQTQDASPVQGDRKQSLQGKLSAQTRPVSGAKNKVAARRDPRPGASPTRTTTVPRSRATTRRRAAVKRGSSPSWGTSPK